MDKKDELHKECSTKSANIKKKKKKKHLFWKFVIVIVTHLESYLTHYYPHLPAIDVTDELWVPDFVNFASGLNIFIWTADFAVTWPSSVRFINLNYIFGILNSSVLGFYFRLD